MTSPRRAVWAALAGALATVGGCDVGETDPSVVQGVPFEEVFEVGIGMELEDPANDVLGEIGVVVELADGGLVVADALRPRLRRYTVGGRLTAEAGVYGAGPSEYRTIGGLAEAGDGRIVVTDPRLGRVTLLGPDLATDTIFSFDRGLRGPVYPLGDDFAFVTAMGTRTSSLTLYRGGDWTPRWTARMPSPGTMAEYPYWGSVASNPVAVSSNELVVAYSLLYPIRIRDRDGNLVDSLVTPPGSFRQAERVEPGAFAGPGGQDRLETWLASFDVIARMDVVADTLLVVTHGRLEGTPGRRFSRAHQRVDVYHLPTRVRIAEDIALPEGSRVLCGGTALYVLTRHPPEPWTIVGAFPRAALRASSGAGNGEAGR